MRAEGTTAPTLDTTNSGEEERVDEATRVTRAENSIPLDTPVAAVEMVRSTPARFARAPRRPNAGGESRCTLFSVWRQSVRKAMRFASRGVARDAPDGASRGSRARASRPSQTIAPVRRVSSGGPASRARRRDVTGRGPARQVAAERSARYFRHGDTLRRNPPL